VYVYPAETYIVEANQSEREIGGKFGGPAQKRAEYFLRLRMVTRFVNTEDPSDYIQITTYGDGIDSLDKATGKATTYASKYARLKAYSIESGADPDLKGSESQVPPVSGEELDELAELIKGKEKEFLKKFGVKAISELTQTQYKKALALAQKQ